MIPRNQGVNDAFPLPFYRPAQAVGMQMTVNAACHTVFFHELDDLTASKIGINGRIVQKTEFFLVRLLIRSFQRSFQTKQLPVEDLFVMTFLKLLLKEPPPRTTESGIFIKKQLL